MNYEVNGMKFVNGKKIYPKCLGCGIMVSVWQIYYWVNYEKFLDPANFNDKKIEIQKINNGNSFVFKVHTI